MFWQFIGHQLSKIRCSSRILGSKRPFEASSQIDLAAVNAALCSWAVFVYLPTSIEDYEKTNGHIQLPKV